MKIIATLKSPLSVVLSLFTILYLLGNSQIAITDPVESNYTLTALEMLKANDYMSPRIYGNYWFDKPIFFYWELIGAYKLFGINEFASRLFPTIFSISSLGFLYWFTTKIADRRLAITAVLVLGTSFAYWLLAKTVITDSTLFLFFNATLAFFYLAYSSNQKYYYYFCYIFAALSTLTKGPIGFLLPGLIIVLFLASQRNFIEVHHMKLPLGLPLFLVIAGSWYGYMYALHGSAFLDTFLGVHNVLRATVSEHPKDNVWYYYTAIFFAITLPWGFTVPKQLYQQWKQRIPNWYNPPNYINYNPTTMFLLIWAITINVFFQCMATKYTTYTYPSLFPIAILMARYLVAHPNRVKVTAFITGITYIVLTYTLAIPLTNQFYSGKHTARYIESLSDTTAPIYFHGNYRASIPFYSGKTIIRVVQDESLADTLPGGINWNAKNVMPITGFKEIDANKTAYLIESNPLKNNRPFDLDLITWSPVLKTSNTTISTHIPTH